MAAASLGGIAMAEAAAPPKLTPAPEPVADALEAEKGAALDKTDAEFSQYYRRRYRRHYRRHYRRRGRW
ncbi:hypothetical protein DWF00_09215 [Bosea caraganae]|uniref:Uncharacterized protein n=2 Tax=Bosea caraganae TaxID=2763117 RepID=A0A370LB30_9HYPH|nr:hypothetical protein DWF00_09215 [Bosea caraganae]RDJ29184.1 hypothetical protein DWE98_00990 [Bosea caraganae]